MIEKNKKAYLYDPRRYYDIRDIYKGQLKKFKRLGVGKKTEFGTVVTQKLIDITRKRYLEICEKTFRYTKKHRSTLKRLSDITIDELIENVEIRR